MLGGFLTVIGGILSLVMFIMTRKAKRDDDPIVQMEKARNENAKLIVKNDAQGISIRLDALLNRVSDLQGSAKR